MADKLEFHPLADLFPLMTDEELDALGNDMLEHGQQKEIDLFEGKILEGRNRYLACLRKGIEPRFRSQMPADPAAFVASANLQRRHLDASQRAMIAAQLATMKQGRRKTGTGAGLKTQADAAALLEVSERSVRSASAVVDHGTDEVVTAVKHGEVPVKAAAEFVQDHTPKEQAELIAKAGSVPAAVEAAKKQTKGKGRRKTSKGWKAPPPTLAKGNLIDAIRQLAAVDVKDAARWMSDDERAAIISDIIRVADKAVIEMATVGGAMLGKLAPTSERFKALEFLRKAITQIDAELSEQAARASEREGAAP